MPTDPAPPVKEGSEWSYLCDQAASRDVTPQRARLLGRSRSAPRATVDTSIRSSPSYRALWTPPPSTRPEKKHRHAEAAPAAHRHRATALASRSLHSAPWGSAQTTGIRTKRKAPRQFLHAVDRAHALHPLTVVQRQYTHSAAAVPAPRARADGRSSYWAALASPSRTGPAGRARVRWDSRDAVTCPCLQARCEAWRRGCWSASGDMMTAAEWRAGTAWSR